jgi:hypothetical protein
VTGERADALDGAELAGHGEELLLGEVGREAVDVHVRRAAVIAALR